MLISTWLRSLREKTDASSPDLANNDLAPAAYVLQVREEGDRLTMSVKEALIAPNHLSTEAEYQCRRCKLSLAVLRH